MPRLADDLVKLKLMFKLEKWNTNPLGPSNISHVGGVRSEQVEPGGRKKRVIRETHQQVARVAVVQELAKEVEVGHKRRLKDDGHVGRVEQLDRVGTLLAPVLLVLDLWSGEGKEGVSISIGYRDGILKFSTR